MIELHLLRYTLAAAETGSFSRAANRFGVKQSTLSSAIHYLESRLGLPLFTRSTRGVTPTDPGRRFVQRAGYILDDFDALLGDARSLANGTAGILRIGCHASLTTGNLASLLRAFRERYPDVEVQASERNRSELLCAIERGRLDIAIATGAPAEPDIASLSLWSEPLIVALPKDHALAKTERLLWTDLRHTTFAVTMDDPGPDISEILRSRLPTSTIRHERLSRDNLLSLVSGISVAIGIGFTARAGEEGPALHHVHDTFGATVIEQRMFWRRDATSAPLAHFMAMAGDRYGRALDGYPG